jgi:hypothetical protein
MLFRDYVDQRIAEARWGFSREEALRETGRASSALDRALQRAIARGWVMPVRRGFYVALPPAFRRYGRLPAEYYLDALCAWLDRPYYLGLHAAAAWHGAAHQRPQWDAAVSTLPALRDLAAPVALHWHARRGWPGAGIALAMVEGIPFRVSDPALTLLDLVHFQASIGGLNRQVTVIEELAESVSPQSLLPVARSYPHGPSVRRLGALLDALLPGSPLGDALWDSLEPPFPRTLPLLPDRSVPRGAGRNRWRIGMNAEPESDL